MTTSIEAAALEIEKMLDYYFGKTTTRPSEIPYGIARAVLATVTPLIRADALEEAARIADDVDRDVAGRDSTTWSVGYFARHIQGTAAAIRALKEQP